MLWLLKLAVSPIGRHLLLAVAVLVAVAVVYDAVGDYREASVRAELERENMEAVDDARGAYERVGDCYDLGGVWLLRDGGRCELPGVSRPDL